MANGNWWDKYKEGTSAAVEEEEVESTAPSAPDEGNWWDKYKTAQPKTSETEKPAIPTASATEENWWDKYKDPVSEPAVVEEDPDKSLMASWEKSTQEFDGLRSNYERLGSRYQELGAMEGRTPEQEQELQKTWNDLVGTTLDVQSSLKKVQDLQPKIDDYYNRQKQNRIDYIEERRNTAIFGDEVADTLYDMDARSDAELTEARQIPDKDQRKKAIADIQAKYQTEEKQLLQSRLDAYKENETKINNAADVVGQAFASGKTVDQFLLEDMSGVAEYDELRDSLINQDDSEKGRLFREASLMYRLADGSTKAGVVNNEIRISPLAVWDEEAVKQEIAGLDINESQKRQAIANIPQMQDEAAKVELPFLQKVNEFNDFVAENNLQDADPKEQIAQWKTRNRNWTEYITKAPAQVGLGLVQGSLGLLEAGQAIIGATALTMGAGDFADPFLDAATQTSEKVQELNRISQEIGGPTILAEIGAVVPQIALQIGVGGAVGFGGSKIGLKPKVVSNIGFGSSVGTALAQSYGGVLSSSIQQLEQEKIDAGIDPTRARAEAVKESQLPAALSGLSTGIITLIGGKRGVEAPFRGNIDDIKAALNTQAFRNELPKLIPNVLKGMRNEGYEEFFDQIAQGIIEQFTFNPDLSTSDLVNNAFKALVIGGITGGGVEGIKYGFDYVKAPSQMAQRKMSMASIRESISNIERDIAESSASSPIGGEFQREYDMTLPSQEATALGGVAVDRNRMAALQSEREQLQSLLEDDTLTRVARNDLEARLAVADHNYFYDVLVGGRNNILTEQIVDELDSRPLSASSREAITAITKIANGQSLDSLSGRERVAVGVTKVGDGRYLPSKQNPMVATDEQGSVSITNTGKRVVESTGIIPLTRMIGLSEQMKAKQDEMAKVQATIQEEAQKQEATKVADSEESKRYGPASAEALKQQVEALPKPPEPVDEAVARLLKEEEAARLEAEKAFTAPDVENRFAESFRQNLAQYLTPTENVAATIDLGDFRSYLDSIATLIEAETFDIKILEQGEFKRLLPTEAYNVIVEAFREDPQQALNSLRAFGDEIENAVKQFGGGGAGAIEEPTEVASLRRVARAEQTPEDVDALVKAGFVEVYKDQPVLTQTGLDALPEADRPRLTPEARKIQIDTGASDVVAEALSKNLRIGVDQVPPAFRMPEGWTLEGDIYIPPQKQEVVKAKKAPAKVKAAPDEATQAKRYVANAKKERAKKPQAAVTIDRSKKALALDPKDTIGKTVREALRFASRINISRIAKEFPNEALLQDVAAILAELNIPALDNEKIVKLSSLNMRGRAARAWGGDIGLPSTVKEQISVLVHEAGHSLTADQIRQYAPRGGGKGKVYIDRLREAINNQDTPPPVARLFSLYISTLEQLGVMNQYGNVGGIAGTLRADTSRTMARRLQAKGQLRTDLDWNQLYALANVEEFVSQTFSSETFRDLLKTLKDPTNPTRSAWSAFVDAIKNLLKLPNDTVAAAVIEASVDVAMQVPSVRTAQQRGVTPSPAAETVISAEEEAQYNEAVANNDTEAAQEIVDRVAKRLGFDSENLLFHGTTHIFNVFQRDRANVENDFGKGYYFTNTSSDAQTNYAGEGPDLTNRIERLSEQLQSNEDMDEDVARAKAKEILSGGGQRIIRAYINLQNPFNLGGPNETFLDLNQTFDENTEEYGEPTGNLVDFVESLRSVIENFSEYETLDANAAISNIMEAAMDNDGLSASEIVNTLRREDSGIVYATDENGDSATNEIIRQAIEDAGFDGIVDNLVNQKFGDERKTGKSMEGMGPDTVHTIVFNSNQIKSADAITRDADGNIIPLRERFDITRPEIDYAPEAQPAITPQQDRDYLDAVERGDLDAASKMVDDAAEKAGYNVSEALFRGFAKRPKPDRFITRRGRSVPSFTPIQEVANLYQYSVEFFLPQKGKGSRLYKFYSQINKPLDLREYGTRANLWDIVSSAANWDFTEKPKSGTWNIEDAQNLIYELWQKESNGYIGGENYDLSTADRGGFAHQTFKDLNEAIEETEDPETIEYLLSGIEIDTYVLADSLEFVDAVRSNGYDGIIHKDTIEAGAEFLEETAGKPVTEIKGIDVEEDYSFDTYRPFEMAQTKLADPVTYDDQGNIIPLSQRFQPEQADIRFNPIGYGIENVISDIEAGRTNGPIRAVNNVVKEATALRDRVKAEAERRQRPRARGKAPILERIASERSSGKISDKTAQALTDFVNSIRNEAIGDTAISIRGAGGVSNFNFGESLVSFFLSQDQPKSGARISIHEFWHGLSRFLPARELEVISQDYTNELSQYIDENPWFLAFVGRYSLTPEQFEAYKIFNPEEAETKLDPVRDAQGNIIKYQIKYDAENYRYIMLDEWIAEKMTDLVESKQAMPDTFMGKLAKVIKEFLSQIEARLGRNAYQAFYNLVTDPNEKINLYRMASVARPFQIYQPHSYNYAEDVSDQIRFSYVGETANMPQFMRESLSVAQAMATKNADSEAIRSVTGWAINPYDGKLRWEIPDKDAAFTTAWDGLKETELFQDRKLARLPDILSHPQLFAAYPELADVVVYRQSGFFDVFGALQGTYDDTKNAINITPNATEPLSTLLHEIQHWIQRKEGFARGGNEDVAVNALTQQQKSSVIDEMQKKSKELEKSLEDELKKKWQLRDFLRGIEETPSRVLAFNEAAQKLDIALNKWRETTNREVGDPVRSLAFDEYEEARLNLFDAAGIEPNSVLDMWDITYPISTAQSFKAIFDKTNDEIATLESRVKSYNKLIEKAKQSDQDFKNVISSLGLSHELYRRIAGEIEARDVQSRKDLTEEQRKAAAPYSSENISPENAIIIFGDTGTSSEVAGGRTKADIVAEYAPNTTEEQKAFDKATSNRVMARSPQLAVAAVRMKNGQITAKEYADIVDTIDPFNPKGADPIPTDSKIKEYIQPNKVGKVGFLDNSGKPRLKAGSEYEFRIDIPTYNRSTASGDTVYAITAHLPVADTAKNVGEVAAFTGIAKVTDPRFMTRDVREGGAITIAMGAGKFRLATVKGKYDPVTKLPSNINDPDVWTEVGYNPVRSSFFVDTRSKNAVVGGSEAIMVGSRVFVKDAELQERPTGITFGLEYSPDGIGSEFVIYPEDVIPPQGGTAEAAAIKVMANAMRLGDAQSAKLGTPEGTLPLETIANAWLNSGLDQTALENAIIRYTNLSEQSAANFAQAFVRQYRVQQGLSSLASAREKEVKERVGTYSFAQRVAEELPPEVADKVSRAYQVLRNEVSAEEADKALRNLSLDQAITAVKDLTNGISFPVRSMMAQIVERRILEYRANTKKSGRMADYDAAVDAHVDFFNWISEYSKELGQGVQAFAQWINLGPDGIARKLRRDTAKIVDRNIKSRKKKLDKIKQDVEEGDSKSFKEATTRSKKNIEDLGEKAGKEEAKRLTIEDEAQKIAQRLAKRVEGQVKPRKPDPLSDLVNAHTRKLNNNFVQEAIALGISPETAAKIDESAKKLDADRKAAKDQREAFRKAQEAREKISRDLARENKYIYGERPTIWENYQSMFAERFARALLRDPKKTPPPALLLFTNRLTQNLIGFVPDTQKATATPQSFQAFIEDALNNRERYQEAFNAAMEQVSLRVEEFEARMGGGEMLSDEGRRTIAAHEFMKSLAPQIKDFPVSEKMINRFVNQRAKALDISLAGAYNQWYRSDRRTRKEMEQSLADALLNDINIDSVDADRLVKAIVKDFKQRAEERRKKALERFKAPKEKIKADRSARTDKLQRFFELVNMGALTDVDAYEIFAERYQLPVYDEDFVAYVYEASQTIQGMEDGLARRLKTQELMSEIARNRGFDPADLGAGFVYANILSSPDTHMVNILDTAINNFANGFADALATGDLSRLRGIVRGYRKGIFEAAEVMKTGKRINVPGFEEKAPMILELLTFGESGGVRLASLEGANAIIKAVLESKPSKVLNAAKYVGRLLEAQDAFNFVASAEGERYSQASRIAAEEGLTGKDARKRMNEILNISDEAYQSALRQAETEGYTGAEAKFRAMEIQDKKIPKEIKEAGFARGLRDVYRNTPVGIAGLLSDKLTNAMMSIENPLVRNVTRLTVSPFVITPINLFNKWLDWSPWGYKRMFFGTGNWAGGKYQVEAFEKGSPERRAQMLKASSSMLLMTVMWGLVRAGVATIHGRGPSDEEERKQWLDDGNKPYTIQFGNGPALSFAYTPWALMLTWMANSENYYKYNPTDKDEQSAMWRLMAATALMPSILEELPFYQGVSDIFETAVSATKGNFEKSYTDFFEPKVAMLFPNLFRYFDRLFDPAVYNTNGAKALLIDQIPFVRRLGGPRLNMFGEPIGEGKKFYEQLATRFVNFPKPSRESRILANYDAYPYIPNTKRAKALVDGEPAQMTAEQYDKFIRGVGQEFKQYLLDNYDPDVQLSPEEQERGKKRISERMEKIRARWTREVSY